VLFKFLSRNFSLCATLTVLDGNPLTCRERLGWEGLDTSLDFVPLLHLNLPLIGAMQPHLVVSFLLSSSTSTPQSQSSKA